MNPSVEVKRNVGYTQAKGTWFCLHVGSVAVYLGKHPPRGWASGRRLELFTDCHRFRYSAFGQRRKA
jgi:hypothetical protein